MAKIALLSWGSHGDVLPFIALAQALQQAGHTVILGAPPSHAHLAAQQGIRFQPLGSAITPAAYQQLMTTLIDEANPRKQLRHLLQTTLLPDLDTQYRDALAAVTEANGVDLVITHWLQLAGMAAAEHLGKPRLTVNLNPQGIMTLAARPPGPGRTPEQGRQRHPGRELADLVYGDEFHHFRKRQGLPPIASVSEYAQGGAAKLLAVSPALLSEDEISLCQNAGCHITGFWSLAAEFNAPNASNAPNAPSASTEIIEPDRQGCSALEAFLDSGDKPIVFSFGSMAGRVEELNAIILQSIRQLGCRAILQGGWAALGKGLQQDLGTKNKLLCIDHVPHAQLFPHAACVIHHGGAGTTAAALRAGTPAVIVWHMLDQADWGNRLAQRQLGPTPLPRRNLQAEQLTNHIRLATTTPSYTANCQRVAQQLAAEQEPALSSALKVIEGWLG